MNIIDDWFARLNQQEEWQINHKQMKNRYGNITHKTTFEKSFGLFNYGYMLETHPTIKITLSEQESTSRHPYVFVETQMMGRLRDIILDITAKYIPHVQQYKNKKQAEKDIKKYIKLIDFVLSKKGGRI